MVGNECIPWEGGITNEGYGRLSFNKKRVLAHRLVLCLKRGIPLDSIRNLNVCHTCDNPPCINPKHLFLGTQADNIKDMEEKGRAIRANSLKTNCKRGHVYSSENTRVETSGSRACRSCIRIRKSGKG